MSHVHRWHVDPFPSVVATHERERRYAAACDCGSATSYPLDPREDPHIDNKAINAAKRRLRIYANNEMNGFGS